VIKLRCQLQLSESVYWYVHEHNKGNSIELYGVNLQYFSASNFHVATISISQCSTTWWDINVALKWMCMGVTLGGMHVELNELTAYDSYLSSNFH